MSWIILAISIVAEVAGSATLMKTEQFSRLWPSLFTLLLYAIAFYGLALSLRQIPLGIAYSVWAGCGIVLTALVGVLFYRQQLDAAAIIGILFIILGVIIINTLSGSITH